MFMLCRPVTRLLIAASSYFPADLRAPVLRSCASINVDSHADGPPGLEGNKMFSTPQGIASAQAPSTKRMFTEHHLKSDTAFHHDVQATLLEELIVLVLEDTRPHLARPPFRLVEP
jgi:hypothetical protein